MDGIGAPGLRLLHRSIVAMAVQQRAAAASRPTAAWPSTTGTARSMSALAAAHLAADAPSVGAPGTADPDGEAVEYKRLWLRACKSALIKTFADAQQPEPAAIARKAAKGAEISAQLAALVEARRDAERAARMKALKENDAEAYLEHINDLKMGSLLNIMEITHNFMVKLGAKVQKQASEAAQPSAPHSGAKTVSAQAAAAAAGRGGGGGGSATTVVEGGNPGCTRISKALQASEDYRRFKEYVASTRDEYQLVHKTTVFVEQQPRGLNATLMPHQMVGLRFLVSLQANNINGILADEMGVGKTIQTLAFLLHLKESKRLHGPHLVLAPLSIVREWREACEMFVPDSMRVCEFHEMSDPRREAPANFDIVLMAINRARNESAALCAVQWSFVVVDEGHKAVSNPETQTAQAISAIPYKHRLVLTGTPLNSDIQELFALLNFINPQLFDERAVFDDVFRRPFIAAGGAASADAQLNEEERTLLVMRMHQILRPFMLRRTKKDIDTSLRISFHSIVCPLTPLQTETLRLLRQDRKLPLMVDGECRMGPVCTKETSAQGICNHAFMVPFFSQLLLRQRERDEVGEDESDSGRLALLSSGKFMVLDVILRRAFAVNEKVVIFSHWLDTIDLLTEFFHFRGWENAFVVLTGASSTDERRECVQRFRNDPETRVFVVSMKAGGCGLNLQIASLIIMLDKDYTATNEDQAIARVFRIGQKNTVRALYLLTNDESEGRIATIADRKNKPRQAIIEGGGYHVQAVTEEERREQLMLNGVSADAEQLDCSDIAVWSRDERRRAEVSQMFDHLIANKCAEKMAVLRGGDSSDNGIGIERGLCDLSEVPPVLINGLAECNQPAGACGRGKRSRVSDRAKLETNDDINDEETLLQTLYEEPSDAVIERLMEAHDIDEDDALAMYRRDALAKQRRRFEDASKHVPLLAAATEAARKLRAEGGFGLLAMPQGAFADCVFPSSMRSVTVSLRRNNSRGPLVEFLDGPRDAKEVAVVEEPPLSPGAAAAARSGTPRLSPSSPSSPSDVGAAGCVKKNARRNLDNEFGTAAAA